MRRIVLLSTLLLLPCFVYAQPVQDALNLQDSFVKVSKEVGPAVVSISTEHVEKYQTRYYPFLEFQDEFFNDFFNDFFVSGPEKEFRKMGIGSGVIIDRQGYVLTNEHVVRGADKITVTLPDGREFDGRLRGSDLYSDLAVVKIEPKGELPFAKLGDSDSVKIGHWAIAIGNPFGYSVINPEPTVTVGVVSALRRSLPRTDRRGREYSDLIQTDAAINPGNSGGPLVNIYGEVIGINVAILTKSGGSEGIGFAIPVNTAKKIMEDLIEGREVLHGWLGVEIQDIDRDLAEYFGLSNTNGILISRVVEGSPAENAGLTARDVIVSFDGEKIRNTRDLVRLVLKKDIGEEVKLGILRNQKSYSVAVNVGVNPGEKTYRKKKEKKATTVVKNIDRWRGMEVSDLTADIKTKFKLTVESGVIVMYIEPSSSADQAGIRVGDVIYEIDRKPVKNKNDYADIASKVSGDILVGTHRGYVVIKEE